MSNDTMILHHYEFSPFGEKVRAMFGAGAVSWQSVIVPAQPPRPSLTPMITGYRKSPIAQVGADLYCDTRAIADEIARRTGRAELSPLRLDNEQIAYQEHVEGPVFAACLAAVPKSRMLWKLVTGLGLSLIAFVRDRSALAAKGGLDVPGASEAVGVWKSHLADLDRRVANGYLGGPSPNHLDFACYHLLWFYELMSDSDAAEEHASLARWRDDIKALGHGTSTPLDVEGALAVARESEPAPITDPGDHPNLGQRVAVAATDYGRDATEGVLVSATGSRWVLARETAECGLIHVHFPTRGFALTAA